MTKRDQTLSHDDEDDLNDDGQRVTVLDSQSEEEDDFTSEGNIVTNNDTETSDNDDEFTSQTTIPICSPVPTLTDNEDLEDDMQQESLDMVRMMDDLTVSDSGENDKGPIKDKEKLDSNNAISEDINSLWQNWSMDSNSDIFTVADLIQETHCTHMCETLAPTPTLTSKATTQLTPSVSSPPSTTTGRLKKFLKR